MAFDPSFMPVNWLYEWYAGFTAALQTEVNKEYGYTTYDDMKQDWGSFEIDGNDILNGALATFSGSQLAGKTMPVKPITIQTDDGPRAVIATGQMITAATGEAVRLKIDGFLTSIPWDTVVAEVMMANNYQIQPNMLTELTCKIASQITGQVITDTSNLYVTGKVTLDGDGVARSYVDDYVIQGLLDGAAAANLLQDIIAEDVPVETPVEFDPADAPAGDAVIPMIYHTVMSALSIAPADFMQDDDWSKSAGRISALLALALSYIDTTIPGWYMTEAFCQEANGVPYIYLGICKYNYNSGFKAVKYTSGSQMALEFSDHIGTWRDSSAYTPAILALFRATPDEVEYRGDDFATQFYGGLYEDMTLRRAYLGNILTQYVVAPEIEQHDIDAWAPTQEDHDIDICWPGWMDGARIGTGAIDVDSDVWFPTRDIPLGIDQTDVADPAQTISKPLDVAQAGAIAGAEAGAISLTDTIADAITIPSIYNPAIAIPATTSPTPTPTPVIPVLPPSISAQRLYTVHQVSQAQIDALGAYLWSSDFISLIEHMFTEPIDAVIGLHTLFYGGSLPVGSTETIKLGAVSATGCTGQLITNQFMKFQCGSVNIPEYWNNANDYAPYTEAEIFLPFIGFRDLDINEIMGGSVSLSYGIDIFTGACVAMIGVMRDHISQALYTFEGNCAIQQPVTGADYSRIIGGLISAGMGIATGGAGAVIGTAAALSSHKISYGRSGNISANAGACMPKQPYILIKRPNAYDAPNYRSFYGDPANWTVTLGSCSGYTRVKDVHLDQIACTDVEKDEILSMLKAGVIL